MKKYRVYIPAYNQTFEAKSEAEAQELFNESIDFLQDTMDEMLEIKIQEIK